jgi:butyrate kinase
MHSSVLVINPGSTSTKIALYEDGKAKFTKNLSVSDEDIAFFGSIIDQLDMRENQLRSALAAQGCDLKSISVVVGRGGLLRPLPGGIYRVGPDMLDDLAAVRYGEHACNLGAFLAERMAEPLGIGAYIADPVVVDELWDVARVSGHKLFERRSLFHALNQKAVARRWCRENGRSYESSRLIVAHMGGGVSIGLHLDGRVVDVNNALDGEGPFSAERSGTLPLGDLVRLCFSGKYTQHDILGMITGKGGFASLVGTNDLLVVEERMRNGDEGADLAFRAFAYQVAKAIGALAMAASGRVDAIILTGGIAFSSDMMTSIGRMCNFMAPVHVYPGEGEMQALAEVGMCILSGGAVVLSYEGHPGKKEIRVGENDRRAD